MRNRLENLGMLVEHGINTADAMLLQSISRRLNRKDEDACNRPMDDAQQAAHESRVASLERKAEAIAAKYGRVAYHQGDPRGWSLYLVSPDDMRGYAIDSVYDRGLAVTIW
jgi:hypothetical protein